MKYPEVYIAVGSNLEDKSKNLQNAIAMVQDQVGKVIDVSAYMETPPWGFRSEEKFLNAVFVVETNLDLNDLLKELQQIESYLGRRKITTNRYEDRIIDLDIIDYKGMVVSNKKVVVPHPRAHERDFVLKPLFDVNPSWIHPKLNRSVEELLREIEKGSPEIA